MMTNTETFKSAPTAQMLKKAIKKARRSEADGKLPLKAFRMMKREIANAIIKALKDNNKSFEFSVDARLFGDVDRVKELTAWFSDAGLKSPGVHLQQGAGNAKEAVLTIDLTN